MTNVHIYFLLDRSGSMSSIAEDVVGGFNSFLAAQNAEATDGTLMTLVQFDTGGFDVLADAVPLPEMVPLTAATFVPRGGTPLYDALGMTIAQATARATQLAAADAPREDIVFVSFTDGLENSSVEYDRAKVFALVKARQDDGWTFVFMGANQDAYAEGAAIGHDPRSTCSWDADGDGVAHAMETLSAATARRRGHVRRHEPLDRGDFFGEEQ